MNKKLIKFNNDTWAVIIPQVILNNLNINPKEDVLIIKLENNEIIVEKQED